MKSVDELQEWMCERDDRFNSVTRSLLAEYATQRNVIEVSGLPIGDALVVKQELDRQFFKNMTILPASGLVI